jgi:acyl-coenzyme A thioesterase 13
MSSTKHPSSLLAAALPLEEISTPSTSSVNPLRAGDVWVDPATLPTFCRDIRVTGSASQHAKQLTANTLAAYGVGTPDCFAHSIGRRIKLVDVSVERNIERMGRTEATTVAEIVVGKGALTHLDRVSWFNSSLTVDF